MGGASNKIALVEIIRPDTAKEKFVDEILHHLGAIIDAFQEDTLVPERNPAIRKAT
jgi:hypothetical protein